MSSTAGATKAGPEDELVMLGMMEWCRIAGRLHGASLRSRA